VRAFAFWGLAIHYIAYLDEFGHIGPYISRIHAQHNTSPVFGLGGLLLPASKVRAFSTWFYQLKGQLLNFEIEGAGVPAYRWEKKGSALFTTTNVLRYPELRKATFRLLNRIERDAGIVFYVGIQKTHSPERNSPKEMYCAILREAIKRVDQYCATRKSSFHLMLDEQEDNLRHELVAEASRQMFGEARRAMIEPPIQAESHLFQTLQCADWLCGLVDRIACYKVSPGEFPELNWTDTYFATRLKKVAPTSGIRQQVNISQTSGLIID